MRREITQKEQQDHVKITTTPMRDEQ